MDKFLPHDDELGKVINTAANELYMKMHHLDVDGLGMPEQDHSKGRKISDDACAIHIRYSNT